MLLQFLHILLLLGVFPNLLNGTDSTNLLLNTARERFYECVEDASKLPEAVSLFKTLQQDPMLRGRATVYLGALEALRGKHAIFPVTKYKHTVKGLELMDRGLQIDSDDIESLFIHGSTCYFLPFFFGRKNDAQRDFQTLVRLLPDRYPDYKEMIVINVIDFLMQYAKLSEKDIKTLHMIKYQLKTK
jgi:hypothetical protein